MNTEKHLSKITIVILGILLIISILTATSFFDSSFSAAQKFQYTAVRIPRDYEEIGEILNKLGEQGWELVTADLSHDICIFKR